MKPTKPAATLSLDLDNLWSYMKTGAVDGWQDYPSYFDVAVPRLLELFDRYGLRVTVFVVGQDAALKKNAEALAAIAAAGHEIANHSFHHDVALNRYADNEIERDFIDAEAAIVSATGISPRGFRGPGFALNSTILNLLAARGYRYDASTFPAFTGPAARAYYSLRSGFDKTQRRERSLLFGSLSDGLRSLKPYRWDLPSGRLVEMPVTTIPVVRTPFHLSYLAFLEGFSPAAARGYFRTALLACKSFKVPPSLLLHPLDVMGSDDIDTLRGFPGMGLSSGRKRALVDDVLKTYSERFQVFAMGDYVDRLGRSDRLTARKPDFEADKHVRTASGRSEARHAGHP